MKILQKLYNSILRENRLRSLTRILEAYLPEEGSVLDIGCGDGSLAVEIKKIKPNLDFTGVEVKLRENLFIPIKPYDGINLPHPDKSFDYTMLIHVLHHTDDYLPVLREAKRVARKGIILMDHNNESLLDYIVLRIRDWPANVPFGIHTPYNYISHKSWEELFKELDLKVETYSDRLYLYGKPLDLFLGRDMDFVSYLTHIS